MSSEQSAVHPDSSMRAATDNYEYPDIGSYALIGDCRSAGLVSLQGSIDWLCLPDYSSPPVFAALVDRHVGGRLAVRPAGRFRAERRYLPGTCVLETLFETPEGQASVTDFMPLGDDGKGMEPQREIVRIIEGLRGRTTLEVIFDPRPDFGRRRPRLHRYGRGTLVWRDGREMLVLRSDGILAVDPNGRGAGGTLSVDAGTRVVISLAYSRRDIGTLLTGQEAVEQRDATCRWWREWSGRCSVPQEFLPAVVRSAMTLKLLCSALSGAVIAAPTSSLPETVGGVRNWDYRYCWLRDASLTLRAFIDLGYQDEAGCFLDWLLHTTRLTRPRLNVLYDLFGEHHLPERELKHLEGYRRSAPVRSGNDAADQLQLDVYGAVLLAAMHYVRRGGSIEGAGKRMLVGFGKEVMRSWRLPDNGIWEVRGGKHHYTYSKLMCWAALDALLELQGTAGLKFDRQRVESERALLREAIETRGYSSSRSSYVSIFDGDGADAALLSIARVGFHDPDDERMAGTWRYIEAELGTGELIRRYPPRSDGLRGQEGAMLLTSFWAVDYLARAGRTEEATQRFRKLLQHTNDVGLLAEEVGVTDGMALGNFPQAFSHLGLITAALSLTRPAHGDTGQ